MGSTTSPRLRFLLAAAALGLVAVGQGVVSPTSADAALLDTPARTWGVGPADPTSATVELAAMPNYSRPAGGDYHAGDWDVTLIGQYVAEFNPGPGGLALAAGEYYCWLRITDPFAGETVVCSPGTLIVQ